MSESATHVIHVLHSLDSLARAFDERLTPPFEDAGTDAEVHVLHQVRMGYHNGDQLPITADSTAEAGAAEVLMRTVQLTAIASLSTPHAYLGRQGLWDEPTSDNVTRNPFALLEQTNGWDLTISAFRADEVRAAVSSSDFEALTAQLIETGADTPIVVSWSETPVEDFWAGVAREYAIYEQAIKDEKR